MCAHGTELQPPPYTGGKLASPKMRHHVLSDEGQEEPHGGVLTRTLSLNRIMTTQPDESVTWNILQDSGLGLFKRNCFEKPKRKEGFLDFYKSLRRHKPYEMFAP